MDAGQTKNNDGMSGKVIGALALLSLVMVYITRQDDSQKDKSPSTRIEEAGLKLREGKEDPAPVLGR